MSHDISPLACGLLLVLTLAVMLLGGADVPRVLVLEDETDYREQIVAALEGDGHVVLAVSTLADALEQRGADWDVVLADPGLPDSRGLDTVRGVLGAFPGAPCIVLTGIDSVELAKEGGALGAVPWLQKERVRTQDVCLHVACAAAYRSSPTFQQRAHAAQIAQAAESMTSAAAVFAGAVQQCPAVVCAQDPEGDSRVDLEREIGLWAQAGALAREHWRYLVLAGTIIGGGVVTAIKWRYWGP